VSELIDDMVCALDPAEFARSVGFEPDPWQVDFLRSKSNRVCLNIARQRGKSTTAGLVACHEAVYAGPALILLVSRSERQAGELFRKVLEFYRKLTLPKPLKETGSELELFNGSRIVSLPSSEETVRSFSGVRLIIEDEASRVPNALDYAIRPMLSTSGGRLIKMSTPFGKRGHFYAACQDPATWEIYTVVKAGDPRTPQSFLDEERRSLPDFWFRQEYECSFEDNVSSLFKSEDILTAFEGDVPPLLLGDDIGCEILEFA
jgi:hypothetical protein